MSCLACDGEGRIMVCLDDICRGGGCLRELGGGLAKPGCFQLCAQCDGEGDMLDDEDDAYEEES